MKLNNIYKNHDKKLIQEDWEYLNLREKLEFIMSKGDTPLHYTMFKSPQDIIKLCPEGSFFYRFNDDDTVDSLYQIMKYKDDKAYIRTIKYGLRNMLFDLDLNTLFKNIKNCSIIPIKFNG